MKLKYAAMTERRIHAYILMQEMIRIYLQAHERLMSDQNVNVMRKSIKYIIVLNFYYYNDISFYLITKCNFILRDYCIIFHAET